MHEYIVNKVVRVVDGDTIDVSIDLEFNIFTIQRVRLLGIDTPEIHTKDFSEKQHGEEAKRFVINFVEEAEREGYQIYVKTTWMINMVVCWDELLRIINVSTISS